MPTRICDKSIRCQDPGDPLVGISSTKPRPAVPADSGIVFGNPDTGVVFGIPNDQIVFGIPIPYCPPVRCPGEDLNYSTECGDVDYIRPFTLFCACLGDHTSIFIRAPGIGPYKWTVGALPPGLNFLVDHPCTGILTIIGTITQPGRYFVEIDVTDGFGNFTRGELQFNVIQITTTGLPPVTVSSPYSFQMEAVGGSGRYAWKILSGALAPGLLLNQDGSITGTPTDQFPPSVTIHVIDTECETPDISYTSPYATLTGESITTTARLIGFAQFGNTVPPKAYRTVSWVGSTTEAKVTQRISVFNITGIVRIRAVTTRTTVMSYCGSTSIDIQGNQVTARQESGYFNDFRPAIPPDPTLDPPFPGLPELNGSPITVNGPCFFGPVTASGLLSADFNVDPGAFKDGPTTSGRDSVFGLFNEGGYTEIIGPDRAEKHQSLALGTTASTVDKVVILSDEFTDTDAMNTATLAFGVGLVAASFPRTTGYVSTWTSVTFTLSCHNLMPGQAYVARVQFLHSGGATTSVDYPFVATGTDFAITDSIPTPPDHGWTQARSATINIA